MKAAADNYEEMKNRMALSFLQHDSDALIRKYALRADETYLYLRFFSRNYRLSRRTGQVEGSDDGFQSVIPANYNEAMRIYDVLCYPPSAPRASGNFVSLASLSKIQGGSLAQKGGFFFRARRTFLTGTFPRCTPPAGRWAERRWTAQTRLTSWRFSRFCRSFFASGGRTRISRPVCNFCCRKTCFRLCTTRP